MEMQWWYIDRQTFSIIVHSAKKNRIYYAGLMLVNRLRRWPNIKPHSIGHPHSTQMKHSLHLLPRGGASLLCPKNT